MQRRIIKIEPLPQWSMPDAPSDCTRRVAAYARVSTSSDEQLLSVEAQKDYYPKFIATHANWTFVGLYADEGISGTSSRNREEFNRMIDDALDGKIDLIVTKSISRFARNTLDTLTAIRKLKNARVEVFFEKEQIYTFDSKGEFMLTLLSSMAQEESRSLSENVKWGCRKRFADGRYSLPYGQFLGYRKGRDGKPEIVEEEAVVIRRIYRLYLEGETPMRIASFLTAEGTPSPAGCKIWQVRTVTSILTNEKYYGAALLQKSYTEDFLTKKRCLNNGELPKYYIESDHEPIVSKAVFDEAQRRMGKSMRDNPSLYPFSNKIYCGDCGGRYGRKIQGSYRENKKYRTPVWKCDRRYDVPTRCKTPVLHVEIIIRTFHKAVKDLWLEHPEYQELCRDAIRSSVRADRIKGKKSERLVQIDAFLDSFDGHSPDSIAFDDSSFRVMVERAIVTNDCILTFLFINGCISAFPVPRNWHVNNSKPNR